MSLLDDLKKWVNQGKRSADIDISTVDGEFKCFIWVYDYVLMTGQYIKDISDINLEEAKRQEELKKYEELKKKFEG